MANLNDVNIPMNENEFIAVHELRIDEDDVKEKAILELGDQDAQKTISDYLPENLQKDVGDTTTANGNNGNKFDELNANEPNIADLQNKLNEATDEDNEAKARAAFAFTIDFNDGKVDNKKRREIVERFQSRQQQQIQQRQHRRGLSLSKLDESVRKNLMTSSFDASTKPPVKEKQSLRNSKQPQNSDSDRESLDNRNVVVHRRRQQHARHISYEESMSYKNRHSWSPCTSLKDEAIVLDANEVQSPTKSKKIPSTSSFVPKSSTLQKALESGRSKSIHVNQNKLDVITTPLEYVRLSDDGGSVDAVSEAGTYTLDGDHYTEEEKERMSIDRDSAILLQSKRNAMKADKKAVAAQDIRKDKSKRFRNLSCGAAINNRTSSANESGKSYYSSAAKSPNVAYLDKIKSRVKTAGDNAFPRMSLSRNVRASSEIPMKAAEDDDNDVGTFTSVTACGVLNKSSNPSTRINRKNSLTMLQIDASEYIQPNCRADDNMMRSYTDYEKAKQNEYQLNIFSPAVAGNQVKDGRYERAERPTSVSIKTAPTKNDWIQEWARNARRRNILMSIASGETAYNGVNSKLLDQRPIDATKKVASINQMTQSDDFVHSYDKDNRSASEFGDDINNIDDNNVQLRNRPIQSTTGISARKEITSITSRPPVSPTKIPSPIHSSIRVRGTSANRSFKSSFSVSKIFNISNYVGFNLLIAEKN